MTVNDVDLLVGHDYFVDPNDCSLYIATYGSMTMEKEKKKSDLVFISEFSNKNNKNLFCVFIHSLKFTQKNLLI